MARLSTALTRPLAPRVAQQLALQAFADPALNPDDLLVRLAWLRDVITPRLERFLGYYRNPTTDLSAVLPCGNGASFSVRPFRQYQELGLPARITGFRRAADGGAVATGSIDQQRKEVVIENDIAWRMNTLVDFAAGRVPGVTSTARDEATRRRLTAVIQDLLQLGEQSGARACGQGGLGLLQKLVLQGSIAGSAWIHLRPTAELLARLGPASAPLAPVTSPAGASPVTAPPAPAGTTGIARWFTLEVLEAHRVCPVPDDGGCGTMDACASRPGAVGGAYVAVLKSWEPVTTGGMRAPLASAAQSGLLDRVRSWLFRPATAPSAAEFSFDLFGPTHWQQYIHGRLLDEGANPLGIVPFVRFENGGDPAAASRVGPAGSAAVDVGIGDVEPLIGLQDELNTRLSDRASRVTMTCFRMYLGRGIDDFTRRPVGPGQMWATDNMQASIESFGGDADMPSEDSHINEIREALDKISGVSPIAAGLIRGKLGNLTSAIALRLTLIALLARTERKRAALTQALGSVVQIALEVLDRAGIVASDPRDRGLDVNWPTALPESDIDRLQEAQLKIALGVPRAVVLTELGYGELAIGADVSPAGVEAAAVVEPVGVGSGVLSKPPAPPALPAISPSSGILGPD